MKKARKIIWSSLIPIVATVPCVIVPLFQSNEIVSKKAENDNFASFMAYIKICDDIWCNVTFFDSENGRYCVIPENCVPTGEGKLVVPSSVNFGGIDYPLTEICQKAFKGQDSVIKGADFTNATNLTVIGEQAFYDCDIWISDGTKLDFINTKLNSIGKEAFYDNGSSKNGILIFPPTLRFVGDGAFNNGVFSGKWRTSKIVFTSNTVPTFASNWGPGMKEVKTYVPADVKTKYLIQPFFKSGSDDSADDQIYGAKYYPYVNKNVITVKKKDGYLRNFINVIYKPGDETIKLQNILGLYFKDVNTGEVNSNFKFENDKFSWDENTKAGTYNLQLCSAADSGFPTNITFKIIINDILDIKDGTKNIYVIRGQGGRTQKPWKAYVNDEEITENIKWKFTSENPEINEKFHADEDGIITWDDSLHYTGVFSGIITCTYNNTVSASANIYILIKESSVYTVEGGSTVLEGEEGKSDWDPYEWIFKKDGESIVAEEWSLVGENIDGISISDGKVSWGTNMKCGVYSFSVKAKSHDEHTGLEIEAVSDLCTLTIDPKDVSLKNGSLQLKGHTHQSGYDENAWELYVGDTKVENVNWSIDVDKYPEWFSISSDGRIKWDENVVSGVYNITLSCSYTYEGFTFEATLDEKIKLAIYDTPYIVPGNYLIQTTEFTPGHDDSIWSVEINGLPISQHVNWSLESTSGIPNENIWINDGQINWNKWLGIGSYSFYVIAQFEIDGIQYSLKDSTSFTLYIKPNLDIKDGNYNLNGVHGTEGQSPDAWNVYLNDKLVDRKDVNYELHFVDEKETDQIKIDSSNGLIYWTKDIPTGIYQFAIEGYVSLSESIYEIETDIITLTIIDVPPSEQSNLPLILGLGLGAGFPVLFGISFGITYGIQKLPKKHKK